MLVRDDGRVFHTIRYGSEQNWQPAGDVGAEVSLSGHCASVACGWVQTGLQVFFFTGEGRVFHTIRARNAWQAAGDVGPQASLSGFFIGGGCSNVGNDMHVCMTPANPTYPLEPVHR